MTPDPACRLRLLGPFALYRPDGSVVDLPGRRDRALLALLAVGGRLGRERAWLAEILWPDRSAAQASKSLRQSLVHLRRALGPDVIPVGARQRLTFDGDRLAVDAVALERATRGTGGCLTPAAGALYQGEFLADLDVPSTPFEHWVTGQRARFQDMGCRVYAHLVEARLRSAAWEEAIEAAQRLVAVDPLREASHRLLMRALDGARRRSEALQTFHRLSGRLRAELDVRPDPETLALYEQIRSGGAAGAGIDPRSPPDARPGVAVLPFEVAPDDPESLLIADGLLEDVIDALAPQRWFRVTSVYQARVYRERPPAPTALRSELGVRYVVGGSLRRTGERLLLRVHVSETDRGDHLLSRRFECGFDDVCAVSPDVAHHVALVIEPELLSHEAEVTARYPGRAFEAWRAVVRSRHLTFYGFGKERALAEARALARQAVALEPEIPLGHACLALAIWMTKALGLPLEPGEAAEGIAAAERAIELDPRHFLGHAALGSLKLAANDHDASERSLRRAIDLNPSSTIALNQLIACLTVAGRPREALDYVEPLDRISPSDPFVGYYRCARALTYFLLGDDAAAHANAVSALADHPGWLPSEVVLIAAKQRTGDPRAAALAGALRGKHRRLRVHRLRERLRFRHEEDFRPLAVQLVAAGLPD